MRALTLLACLLFVPIASAKTYRVSARDPDSKAPLGDARETVVTVHTKGMYVPGPQLFAAMLAIGLAALLLGRR